MLREMRADICSHRDTFTFCVLFSWGGKLLVLAGSEDLLTYTWRHAKANLVVQANA
jgi:hypothetical protein